MDSKGGGLAAFIKSSLPAGPISPPTGLSQSAREAKLEFQMLAVRGSPLPQIFLNIYQPKPSSASLEALNGLLTFAHAQSPYVILSGDLNCHHQAWGQPAKPDKFGEALLDILIQHDMHILNSGEATFINPCGKDSAIDVTCVSHSIFDAGLSEWCLLNEEIGPDHRVIQAKFAARPARSLEAPCQMVWRNLDQLALPKYQLKLMAMGRRWYGRNLTDAPMDNLWQEFLSDFVECAVDSIGTRRRRPADNNPWPKETDEVTRARRNRNNARQAYLACKSRRLKDIYRQAREAFRTADRSMRKANNELLAEQLASSAKPAERFWTLVRAFTGTKQQAIPPLDQEGKRAFAARDKAEVFNHHFTSVSTKPHPSTEQYWKAHVSSVDSAAEVCNSPFSKAELLAQIHHMKTKAGRSPGLDTVTVDMLAKAPDIWLTSLLCIFNESWRRGKLPTLWKTAKVTPLSKNTQPSSRPTDYRPISLLSIPAKLMERMVLQRLQAVVEPPFLDEQKLSDNQFGFRPYRSTQDALTRLQDRIEAAFRNKNAFVYVSTDISKAYDSADPDAILKAIHEKGVGGPLLCWLSDFLNGRFQAVEVDGFLSKFRPVAAGVPQGSCLSPTLFSCLIDQVLSAVSEVGPEVFSQAYADDANFGQEIKLQDFKKECPESPAAQLQSGLTVSAEAVRRMGCSYATAKFNMIVFRRDHDTHWNDAVLDALKLTIGGHELTRTSSVKQLGVIFDEHGSFAEHRRACATKAGRVLGAITRLKYTMGLTPPQFIQLYKALVWPLLELGCHLWFRPTHYKKSELRGFRAVQHRALCSALGVHRAVSSTGMESILHLPPISLRLQRQAGRYLLRTRKNPALPSLQTILGTSNGAVPKFSIQGRLNECISYFPRLGLNGNRASRHRRCSAPPAAVHQEPRFTHLAKVTPLVDNVYRHACRSWRPKAWIYDNWGEFLNNSSELLSIFVDGSAETNPGKTAFGANFYHNNCDGHAEEWHISMGYSNMSLIGEAELAGINYSLRVVLDHLDSDEYTQPSSPNRSPRRVVIFSDSRDAIDNIFRPMHRFQITTPWRLVDDTRTGIANLVGRGWEIHFVWIPGHIGFEPHDQADRRAKSGLNSLSVVNPCYGAGVTVAALYAHLDSLVRESWKCSSQGWPVLSKNQSKAQWADCPHANLLRARARLGAIGNAFLNKIGACDKTGKRIRPYCRYCDDKNHVESFEHVVRDCPCSFFASRRQDLLRAVQSIASAYDSVDPSSIHLWLSVHPALSATDSSIIRRRLNAFLRATNMLSCGCLSPAPD